MVKVNVITCCKFGEGYGILLMKHMLDATEGRSIFVYAVTDINVTMLKNITKTRGEMRMAFNRKDTIPFHKKIGFVISQQFQQDHEKFIPPVTVPMIATKNWLKNCLRSVKNNDVVKSSVLPWFTYISFSEKEKR